MIQNTNEITCPFCHKNNRCGVASEQPCWCKKVVIPNELLKQLPTQYKEKTCICQDCIAGFNRDPLLFIKSNHLI